VRCLIRSLRPKECKVKAASRAAAAVTDLAELCFCLFGPVFSERSNYDCFGVREGERVTAFSLSRIRPDPHLPFLDICLCLFTPSRLCLLWCGGTNSEFSRSEFSLEGVAGSAACGPGYYVENEM
jgi:hypothetical protein